MARKDEETPQAAAAAQEQLVDAQQQAFYSQVAARTGWSVPEAEKNTKRLREQGDFFDEEGRWTLDGSGWPVCLKGWKEPTG